VELAEAYDFLARMPVMQRWAEVLRVRLSPEEVIAHKDDFILLTFEPIAELAPLPLQPDLWWLWPMLEFIALLSWLLAWQASKHTVLAV
jgi:hypothetical protein